MSGISEPFIRRPVATTLLAVGLLLVGMTAFRELPVSALPEVEFPTIVVSTFLPGGSAETMTASVTVPLERQLGQIPSLSQMTSVSGVGTSLITMQFELDRNIDAAEQDVQAAINAASSLLPPQLPIPPTYSKQNPADAPILTLAVSSSTLPLDTVDDYADAILAQKISQVSGVGLVTLSGRQKRAVRVQFDPLSLAGAGLTPEDVRSALAAANVNLPKGSLDGPKMNYTLAANDQLFKAEAYEPILIAYKNGAPVRLRDVSDVKDSVENAETAGWANDKRAILLNVQRQPTANVIEVADRIKALLPQLEASLPAGIDVSILHDRTVTVRAAVKDVEMTMLLTIGLVVAVVFVFLRSLRATIIPGVAVPLSIVGTFGIMYLAGYSLNNLTLMALTISTGFVIDDAIVMIENITRYIEAGDSPFYAALKGAKQIGFTIVSLTVSLVAVLIPLLFMGGIIGRLFREFAVTLGAAIVVSAVLSLTLTAMMCGHVLRPHAQKKEGRVGRALEHGFDWMLRVYEKALCFVLRHQTATLLATLATVVVTVVLVILIPKSFFPEEDTGLLVATTEASPDVSFQKMTELQREAQAIIIKDPDVANVASSVGIDGVNTTLNTGRFTIALRPREHRQSGATEIMARLSGALHGVAGLTVYMQSVRDLELGSTTSRTEFQYSVEDADAREAHAFAERLTEKLKTLPELTDVSADPMASGAGLQVRIDRDTASRLGIASQLIDDTLYDSFGQRQVTTIFTQQNLYRVILEANPRYAETQEALSRIYVTAQDGGLAPLDSFVHAVPGETPLAIAHQAQFPAITISFNLAGHTSLGDAVSAIREAEKELRPPKGVRAGFRGTAEVFTTSLGSEPILILAALVTVYIVLGVLYESTIHPITILSTIPSAGTGALVALMATGEPFSVIALIGIVLLIGIVKKNAIMMVDFALEAQREHHLPAEKAIYEACKLRFRPIMMTTAAALLGGVPLALGTGTGSELRRPLGISIVGGLIVSQVLTLFTTPVIYLAMTKVGDLLRPKKRKKADGEEKAAEDAAATEAKEEGEGREKGQDADDRGKEGDGEH